MKQKVDTWCSG